MSHCFTCSCQGLISSPTGWQLVGTAATGIICCRGVNKTNNQQSIFSCSIVGNKLFLVYSPSRQTTHINFSFSQADFENHILADLVPIFLYTNQCVNLPGLTQVEQNMPAALYSQLAGVAGAAEAAVGFAYQRPPCLPLLCSCNSQVC